MKRNFVAFRSTLIVSITCLTVIGVEVRAEWKPTGIRADWGGRDFACSNGREPKDELCNAATRGLVAVCWSSRKTGECDNATEWCTYKKVTLETRPDGSAPGEIYICN